MNKSNLWSVAALVGIIVAVIAVMAYLSAPKAKYSQATLIGLAQALANASTTMYGAAWCPHCKAQKALFGDAFQYVPYVECPDNQKLCLDKGVEGYPTWIAKDGTKYVGEQTVEKLAEVAGYPLSK